MTDSQSIGDLIAAEGHAGIDADGNIRDFDGNVCSRHFGVPYHPEIPREWIKTVRVNLPNGETEVQWYVECDERRNEQ